jgi:hypothetical protein
MTLLCVNNANSALSPVKGMRHPLTVASDTRPSTVGGQAGVVAPAPEDCLARREVAGGEHAAVWWLGAHGGAGESTLEELFAGSRAAGHAWPLVPAGEPAARVVLVARTHAHGLKAAQLAIRDWTAGGVPVQLLGLVLIADAPGRLPHALRQLAGLIAGGAPAVWSLPWIEAWRVGDPPGPANAPKVVHRLLEDLRAMTEAPASVNATRTEED